MRRFGDRGKRLRTRSLLESACRTYRIAGRN